jgi:hypothetical protein
MCLSCSLLLLLLLLLLLRQTWVEEDGAIDYAAWRLDAAGAPTGETFWSLTGALQTYV